MYADVQPSKFCYDISCFRYEKPQSGRLREFHQLGVEVFGTDNTLADSEVITYCTNYYFEIVWDNFMVICLRPFWSAVIKCWNIP